MDVLSTPGWLCQDVGCHFTPDCMKCQNLCAMAEAEMTAMLITRQSLFQKPRSSKTLPARSAYSCTDDWMIGCGLLKAINEPGSPGPEPACVLLHEGAKHTQAGNQKASPKTKAHFPVFKHQHLFSTHQETNSSHFLTRIK